MPVNQNIMEAVIACLNIITAPNDLPNEQADNTNKLKKFMWQMEEYATMLFPSLALLLLLILSPFQ